jgi:hypothetical protein
MAEQKDWRFCVKCMAMFFDGDPARKGSCPAGSGHTAMGFNFVLPFDVPESGTAQKLWRFCAKCMAMFFDGDPARKGVCSAGGGHSAQGFMFVLPHDVPESAVAQGNWRFCVKCMAMFFDGDPARKGACPAGAGHNAQGFMFVLPHHDEIQVFDSGPITSNLPLGGSAHLVITKTGAFTFTSHAHDSGFDNINYTLGAVLMTPSGLAFTFSHQGGVEGTSAGLPFGTPRRDDDKITAGSNKAIKDEFGNIFNSILVGKLVGTDTLVSGVQGVIGDALKAAAAQLGKAAATSIVALV